MKEFAFWKEIILAAEGSRTGGTLEMNTGRIVRAKEAEQWENRDK